MKIGIVGYGNLGKACEKIAHLRKDMDVVGIFTRRNPSMLTSPYNTPFYAQSDVFDFYKEIDVLVLCTGSAGDLMPLALDVARVFNTADTFDNHSKMKEYVQSLDSVAREHGTLSIVGAGWDPGVLSLVRCYLEGVTGIQSHTFWGKGVSQGHSEAIRKIKGVKRAVQYTLPNEDALEEVKRGHAGKLSTYDKHKRVCYVVLEKGANKCDIERRIKDLPSYFYGYDTEVHFITENDFEKHHCNLFHKGQVLCYGNLSNADETICDEKGVYNHILHGGYNTEVYEKPSVGIEFNLSMASNPDFTATVLLSYVRCAHRLYQSGERGAKTVLDLPMGALFDCNRLDTIAKYL